MSDPRQHVRPGQKLAIAASQINALNAMMRKGGGFESGGLAGYAPGGNILLVKNMSGTDVEQWGILAITGIEINPASGSTQKASFGEIPCLIGGTPAASTFGTFVIAIEPIKSGKVGRAVASGYCQVKLQVTTENDNSADAKEGSVSELKSGKGKTASILWKQSGTGSGKWAIVLLGGGGNVIRLCKTASAFNKGAIATLNVWEDGTPPNETQTSGETVEDVVNKYGNIGSGKFVSVAKHGNGRWYVVAAECS